MPSATTSSTSQQDIVAGRVLRRAALGKVSLPTIPRAYFHVLFVPYPYPLPLCFANHLFSPLFRTLANLQPALLSPCSRPAMAARTFPSMRLSACTRCDGGGSPGWVSTKSTVAVQEESLVSKVVPTFSSLRQRTRPAAAAWSRPQHHLPTRLLTSPILST